MWEPKEAPGRAALVCLKPQEEAWGMWVGAHSKTSQAKQKTGHPLVSGLSAL